MEFLHFVREHGFDLFAYALFIGSFLVATLEVRHLVKAQRINNLLTVTRDHREIWSELYRQPRLARVLEPKLNLTREPVTNTEALFVTFVILHLKAAYNAQAERMLFTNEALERDVHWFFSLPIPNSVWNKSKQFQDPRFMAFVDGALTNAH